MAPFRARRGLVGQDARGFTLVEVLVVIIIIGLLAAVAVPVYLNQRSKAYRAQVRMDAHALARAYETWSVDRPGEAYPDIYHRWVNPGMAPISNTPPAGFDLRLSPDTSIHAFDLRDYYGHLGTAPGAVYCIEITAPTLPRLYYRSDKGGLLPPGVGCANP